MIWPQCLFINLQRTLVQRFYFGVFAKVVVQQAKVVEATRLRLDDLAPVPFHLISNARLYSGSALS